MSDDERGDARRQQPWTYHASNLFSNLESAVLVLIGVALVLVALLLLYTSMYELNRAVHQGSAEIQGEAIVILNTVLLVMMTMEIVYTVAITLKSHTLDAEPFLIIGVIAGIRRMLVITAISTDVESQPGRFHNMLVELGLLALTVVALAAAIWIFRYSAHKYVKANQLHGD
jgi:CDP-diglyceride synthetase